MRPFEEEVAATQQWFDSPRFAGIVRLYTARQVVEQRGTIASGHTVAREAAAAFHDRLRQLFAERKCITTFGPYSPGQAVAMKRMGIEGIYPSTTGVAAASFRCATRTPLRSRCAGSA
jgi:isocitrate lyase